MTSVVGVTVKFESASPAVNGPLGSLLADQPSGGATVLKTPPTPLRLRACLASPCTDSALGERALSIHRGPPVILTAGAPLLLRWAGTGRRALA